MALPPPRYGTRLHWWLIGGGVVLTLAGGAFQSAFMFVGSGYPVFVSIVLIQLGPALIVAGATAAVLLRFFEAALEHLVERPTAESPENAEPPAPETQAPAELQQALGARDVSEGSPPPGRLGGVPRERVEPDGDDHHLWRPQR